MQKTPSIRLLLALSSSAVLAGCLATGNPQLDTAMNAGGSLFQAATLSDDDIAKLSDQACAEQDATNKVAAPGSKYDRRLQSIVKGMEPTVNGRTINYKVYQTDDVNAWAMGNGCVRVYSGLMDKMTDDEVRGVVGHEIGHVALGHSKRAMQLAYTTKAARDASGLAGASVAALSQPQLGDIAESFVNAQFSQSQETAADNYSYDQLKAKGFRREGLATAFEKLAAGSSGTTSATARMFSSHPESLARAENIRTRIAADGGDAPAAPAPKAAAKKKPAAKKSTTTAAQ
ncbi:MAG: Metalloprotease LoiP [Paracidovorax wautersii]|uniref:Metalloprotease LoiP n=1 Tax=Paracidovorax wautersii TaxID=1177982 RepID=A0A7V8FNM0_9BURK|nr:MAG: Metalloprotease LoiP [Paracidovorax wautersii]